MRVEKQSCVSSQQARPSIQDEDFIERSSKSHPSTVSLNLSSLLTPDKKQNGIYYDMRILYTSEKIKGEVRS
jgi:hypothetical protein